jgi:hypothetical protein
MNILNLQGLEVEVEDGIYTLLMKLLIWFNELVIIAVSMWESGLLATITGKEELTTRHFLIGRDIPGVDRLDPFTGDMEGSTIGVFANAGALEIAISILMSVLVYVMIKIVVGLMIEKFKSARTT